MLLASYAKINLYLEVLAKLPDNYHQIETLLCSVSVFDTLKYALTKKPDIKLWSNLPEMTVDNNLIYQVSTFMRDKYDPQTGVEIYLDKQIPIAAGLGGGSSNAATTIMALNILWELGLSLAEMEDIAAMFGSDVCFFLQGGTAFASNKGEVIAKRDDLEIERILLVNPRIAINSSTAYQLVQVPDSEKRRQFVFSDWRHNCYNRLEPGIRKAYPVVDDIISKMMSHNAMPAMMSGSGSTCFGIFDTDNDLKRCMEYFSRAGYWTKQVKTVTRKEFADVFKT